MAASVSVGDRLDLGDAEFRREGDLHGEDDHVRAQMHRQELGDAVDAFDCARPGSQRPARLVFGRRAFADEQPVGDPREHERDGAEEHADDDAAQGIPEVASGPAARRDGEERQREAHHGGRVFGEDERDGRVARLEEGGADRLAAHVR